jgi:hypothetical protein
MDSQRWEQPHVLYGQDHILKVNKPKSRPDLIKEAKLASYLNERELPFKFSEPVEIHPLGYFAVFKRLDDRHLTTKRLNAYSPAQMTARNADYPIFLVPARPLRFTYRTILILFTKRTDDRPGDTIRSPETDAGHGWT